MPDLPARKRRPPPVAPARSAAGPMRYAELHAKTNFSFLEGASHPDELVQQAAALGLAALAVTDVHSLAGMVRAHVAAKEAGLPLVVGAEVRPLDAAPLVLWVTDRAAYARLARLLTLGRRRAPKGECHLRLEDLAGHAAGLLAGVLLAPRGAEAPSFDLARSLGEYRDLFGDRCYGVAELFQGPDDQSALAAMRRLAQRAGVPLLAAGDVHYHQRARGVLQDVLTAVRLGCRVEEIGRHRFANAGRCLKSPQQMRHWFAEAPDAVYRTQEIVQRCVFSLDELRYEYPEELAPPGTTPLEYLRQLTWEGARRRYPQGVPPRVHELLEHELALIGQLRYEAYFLTVWDLMQFARSRGILCQGRGSAANSAVCFCLEITAVDPACIDVLFERFVSRERNEAPDIDVDFEHQRREEVLQYLYQKYGRQRAGMTAEVITYRPRSAVRDVGKALGLSLDRVDALAKALDTDDPEALADRCRQVGLEPDSPLGRRLLWLVRELVGFPRHLSQHVGGMVITHGPLCELVPIENAAMPERTVIQWDKDDLDHLGILKVDCLALGMLTAIHKCFDLVQRHGGPALRLASVPQGDPAVYDMICRADTVGVFQIESRAQMSMLPRLRPRCYYDLVVEVAIVRPGPIQGNMVHPYLRRRQGIEPVEYPSELVRQVLHKTLGVPIFQEQAMRLAVVAAGFTPGEADQLRRAMGAWRRPGLIEQFRQRLIQGMQQRGLSAEFAQRTFEQIRGFGQYGFPESHAASFALLAYVSAWLKYHYPAAFVAALLNSQPMGFYAPAQLVRDLREHGVEVRPVDVNHSDWESTLEPHGRRRGEFALRLGLHLVRGLGETAGQQVAEIRQTGGPFRSLDDFTRRTGLSRKILARLAQADAFGSLELSRRQALWQTLLQEPPLPLFANEDTPAQDGLPPMSLRDQVAADYATAGLSLRSHPMALLRGELEPRGIARADEMRTRPAGQYVRVAGVVLLRQRPSTARGITFVTIEDETGQVNLVVRPDVWQRFRPAAQGAKALVVEGRLQRVKGVVHVVAARLHELSGWLEKLRSTSRDFR